MLKAVLFDLDGTLLHMEWEEFFRGYISRLSARLAPYIEPQVFTKHLMDATEAMIRSQDPHTTNQEVFVREFFQRVKYKPSELMPVFEDFYDREYLELKSVTQPMPGAAEAVQAAVAANCDIVIATNPVFPHKALLHRLRWAGLGDLPIRLVTAYENMHFCKPSLQYYQEIVEYLGYSPRECMMVGNDVQEDLVAGRLGLKTYLATDCLIDRKNRAWSPDYQGPLADLPKVIAGLD